METSLISFLLVLIFNIVWITLYGAKEYLEFYKPLKCKIAILLYCYNGFGIASLIYFLIK